MVLVCCPWKPLRILDRLPFNSSNSRLIRGLLPAFELQKALKPALISAVTISGMVVFGRGYTGTGGCRRKLHKKGGCCTQCKVYVWVMIVVVVSHIMACGDVRKEVKMGLDCDDLVSIGNDTPGSGPTKKKTQEEDVVESYVKCMYEW